MSQPIKPADRLAMLESLIGEVAEVQSLSLAIARCTAAIALAGPPRHAAADDPTLAFLRAAEALREQILLELTLDQRAIAIAAAAAPPPIDRSRLH